MNPQQLTAWTGASVGLITAGIQVATLIGGFIKAAHPDLTPEQRDAAVNAILTDAAVRAALAEQAGRA